MGRSKSLLILAIAWILYLVITILVYGYKKGDWAGFSYEITVSHIISTGVFCATALYVFPKFWDYKKYVQSIALVVLILILSIAVRFFFAFIVSPLILNTPLNASRFGTDELLLKFFYQWFIFFLYSLGFWQATSKISIQRKLSERIQESAKQEKLELENAALRAQINPHFIFNTLDPLRTRTAEVLPDVSKSLGSFMQIIRSGITSPGTDGKIPLEIELDAIDGTIFIYKQRFPNLCLSHISKVKDEDSIRILPHILIPFVENAFKHGVLDDKNNKLKIELNVDFDCINLIVFNKKNKRIKDQSTGIGLKYIKRHLDAGYENKYKLIINETAEDYAVNLSVQLN